MNELKPCPFCGGEAKLQRTQHPKIENEAAWIECSNCGAMSNIFAVPLHRIPPRAKVGSVCFEPIRKAWNRRVTNE